LKLLCLDGLFTHCPGFPSRVGAALNLAAHAVEYVVRVVIEDTGLEAVLDLTRRLKIEFLGTKSMFESKL
jgi:hypothetical protein